MLRCSLEESALRKSIANADSAWEDRLVLRHHHMKKASPKGAHDFEDAHKAFHMALLDNARLPLLLRYCSQLYDLNIRYRYLAAGGSSYKKRDINAEHQEILDAALDRDAESATRHLIDHYRRTGDYLSSQMGS